MIKKILLIAVIVVVLLIVVGSIKKHNGATTTGTQPVGEVSTSTPSAYASLYGQLKSQLDANAATLAAQPQTNFSTVYGAALSVANSNRGTALLASNAMQGVNLMLDQFKKLGIQGVTVQIAYPIYTPSFPNYSGYVSYYKQVAQAVRAHGMKLSVESGPAFPAPYSTLGVSYKGLTMDSYISGKHAMVQSIINDLHPDWLAIGSEPDNDASLLGLSALNSPQGYVTYINGILNGLDRGNTKVFAGIGTWGNIDFVKSFVTNTSLDGIDLHIYPISSQDLQTALTAASLAHQAGKQVTVAEAWLFKAGSGDSAGIATDSNIFKRDVYSFWAPLDQEFLANLVTFANVAQVSYISPFWTSYFFSYVNYTPSVDAESYQQLSTLGATQAVQNLMNGTFTSTGNYYSQLIQKNS